MPVKYVKIIFFATITLVIVAAALKPDRFANMYRFVVYNEPYVNRTIKIFQHVLSRTDDIFDSISDNIDYDDRRGHTPSFDDPARDQLSFIPSEAGLNAYQSLLDKYQLIRSSRITEFPSDKQAFDIMALAHGYYSDNLANKLGVSEEVFANEQDYRSEDFVYYLANARTACGTIGEATVSLLRGAGFKARLLRFSHNWNPVTANHIFPEFYSTQQQRWVMLDPMINASPSDGSGGLSGMRMMADANARAQMNRIWNGHMEYTADGIVWFDRKGPFTDIYYFSDNSHVQKKLKNAIAP